MGLDCSAGDGGGEGGGEEEEEEGCEEVCGCIVVVGLKVGGVIIEGGCSVCRMLGERWIVGC